MILRKFTDCLILKREEKIIYAEFLKPHKIISTCRAGGGLQYDMSFMYNHQSCEPKDHHVGDHSIAASDPKKYREITCQRYGLPHEKCVTLGTAANMRYAVHREISFRDLSVLAVCTGGVEGNAGRVGDPASFFETEDSYEQVGDEKPVFHGTINTMLFINKELTDGAMVRTVMTATEAKTAVLQELAVSSKYSDGLATGTGTDQIGVASALGTGKALKGAGKHSVLGELIGKAVFSAIKETLALQNQLTPESQRSCLAHMLRFGLTRESMVKSVARGLDKEKAILFDKNFGQVDRDPLVVASVAALVHLRDKVVWGILPESCVPEILNYHGAQIAATVSGNFDAINSYGKKLKEVKQGLKGEDFTDYINAAIAMGFAEKWVQQ